MGLLGLREDSRLRWLVGFCLVLGLIRSPAGVISGLVDLGVEVKDREGNVCN